MERENRTSQQCYIFHVVWKANWELCLYLQQRQVMLTSLITVKVIGYLMYSSVMVTANSSLLGSEGLMRERNGSYRAHRLQPEKKIFQMLYFHQTQRTSDYIGPWWIASSDTLGLVYSIFPFVLVYSRERVLEATVEMMNEQRGCRRVNSGSNYPRVEWQTHCLRCTSCMWCRIWYCIVFSPLVKHQTVRGGQLIKLNFFKYDIGIK